MGILVEELESIWIIDILCKIAVSLTLEYTSKMRGAY